MSLAGLRAAVARRRWGWSGLAGLLAAVVVALLTFTEGAERLEMRTHDLRFVLRGPRKTNAPIVLVELPDTDPELDPDPEGWWEPMLFWGDHYARMVSEAHRLGAAWIALDDIPQAPADDYLSMANADPAYRPDKAFVSAVVAAGGTVLMPQMWRPGREPANPHLRLFDALSRTGGIGGANIAQSPDAVARLGVLYRESGGGVCPGFAALIAARALGIDPRDAVALRRLAPSTGIRHDPGSFWINYTLADFPRVDAKALALGRLSEANRRLLRGAVVIAGKTGHPSGDTHLAVPGIETAGVEINAQAVATLMDGRALRRWSRPVEAAVSLAFALMALAAAAFLPFGRGIAAAVAAAALWFGLAFFAFAAHDALLPIVGPLAGLLAAPAAFHSARSLEEERRIQQIERTFGRYVSPAIRDHLLATRDTLGMRSEHRDATILFFDIRGSTRLAEGRDPQVVMNELNAFFREVVPVVDRHGGLLYRYTGDGFLAVFGAPYELPDRPHPQAAIDAAMEMVALVNDPRRAAGSSIRRVGCGLHSGPVACGSLGVDERAEFTVIGDTVNLAARLEGLNKKLGSDVVVSAETYGRLAAPPPLRGPETREVDGRDQPATVYYLPAATSVPEGAAPSSTTTVRAGS